jgi:hypothetical protein
MDRQKLEPARNAYDAFVTLPRMAPGLAYRYVFDRQSFLSCESCTSLTSGFPLERANGIQSMETCHALARAGTRCVSMRAAGHRSAGARLRSRSTRCRGSRGCRIESRGRHRAAAVAARRLHDVRIGRSLGHARQDLIFTRDLAIASLLLRVPLAARAPVVYEAHGLAADDRAPRCPAS